MHTDIVCTLQSYTTFTTATSSNINHTLTAEGGRMRTLYGMAVVLLFDTAVAELLFGTTVTNCPGTDDVFGKDNTVTLDGDRAAKLTVGPAAVNGLALMTAVEPRDGDVTPAGKTVTVFRGLVTEMGEVTAGATSRVG